MPDDARAAPSTMLDAALRLAELGLAVFPCRPRGKEPLTRSGFKDATTDATLLRAWWSRWPDANIAVATGLVSGVVVLDVDPRNGGDETLAELERRHAMPATWRTITGGGGQHLWFRHPGTRLDCSSGRVGAGIDLKGDSGYVIVPPSVHPSGRPYSWDVDAHPDDVPLADLPDWLEIAARGTTREKPALPPATPAGVGSLGVLPPKIEDNREQYIRDTVFAVLLELTGTTGAWPTAEEVFDAVRPQLLARIDLSRAGRISAANFDDELRRKCRSIVERAQRGALEKARTLEEAVAAYASRRESDSIHGPGNRQETALPRARFAVTWPCDRSADAAPDDFVEGLLLDGSMACLYGETNAGKTFVALDIAAHVALGRSWRGRAVDQGAVIYCALEGGQGVRRRVEAWRKFHNVAADNIAALPLGIIAEPLDLLNGKDARLLCEAIERTRRELDARIRLVVVDTLSRALAGGNENAPDDMGALVRHLDEIRAATGACLLGIHHPGKDLQRGMRGHSLLRAATDTEIEVAKVEGGPSTIRVTKQRDLELVDLGAFRLEQVPLGVDRRGRQITSAVALPADAAQAKRSRPASKSLTVIKQALVNALAKSGRRIQAPDVPRDIPVVTVFEWRAEAYEMAISDSDKTDSKLKAFTRLSNALLNDGIASKRGEYVWLVP